MLAFWGPGSEGILKQRLLTWHLSDLDAGNVRPQIRRNNPHPLCDPAVTYFHGLNSVNSVHWFPALKINHSPSWCGSSGLSTSLQTGRSQV